MDAQTNSTRADDSQTDDIAPANVEIRETPLGQGVFASQDYRRGEPVGIVTGRILDDPDHSSDYCMDLGEPYSLEPEAPFRFLNHSCSPNCQLVLYEYDVDDPRQNEMHVEAIRRIRPGDELTIDYAWPADQAIPCGCESRGCRGWIVSADEVHLVTTGRQPRRRRPR